ncbi:hypothetical protein D9M69_661590 [compost metagenome]
MLAGRFEVDLVGADAEAPGGHQLVRGGEHLGRQLGARADAHEVHVGDLGLEFGVGQRTRQRLDVGVAGGAQHLHGRGVDAFEQKELDPAFVEGGFAAHGVLRKTPAMATG